jgi:SAM-dependent methyltransferase
LDQTRYSTLAHAAHVFCSPLAEATVDALLARLALAPGARVLDVGCGKAQMLVRLVERYGAAGVGIDPNGAFLDAARPWARDGRLVLHARRVQEVALAPASFDVALCIGSTHALGRYPDALRGLAALVRPGGTLVLGEGYWKQPPAPAYLALLGGTEDEFTTHEGNIRSGEKMGLGLRFAITASDAEWDAYEGLYADSIERFAAAHPQDPDRDAMLARSRAWREGYLKWGRSTLGFGVYAFGRPRGIAARSLLV